MPADAATSMDAELDAEPPCLADLNDDLLRKIASRLAESDLASAVALKRCSSRFKDLATPLVANAVSRIRGEDRELRKSGDATHLATDGPAPRHYDGHTTAPRVRVAVFVRSEKSNALVGDGVPGFRRARRTSTALSVACSSLRQKPGVRAEAPLFSTQMAQPTVQLSQRWARPHWPPQSLCAAPAACVSDTARRLPAHCDTMGAR